MSVHPLLALQNVTAKNGQSAEQYHQKNKWSTRISLLSVMLATLFSIGVGIGFGHRLAHQAAKLNPIEALRYE